jgi:WD40 repeat protein
MCALNFSLLPAFAQPIVRRNERQPLAANPYESLFKNSNEASAVTTPSQNKPVRLCILSPTIKKGSLSGEAFVDRLIGLLKPKEQIVQAAILENATDPNTLKREAAKEGCQLLLFLTIAGDSPTFRLPFGAKYKLEVQYRVDDVDSGQISPEQTLAEKGKDAEAILRSVLNKIVETVLSKAASPAAPTQPGSTPPLPDNGNANAAPVRTSTTDLFSASARPRLVVQTSHTSMVTDFVYSPNGKLLATLAADGVVKLWLTSKGQEIVSVPGYQVIGMAFNPDSRSIACLSKNGVLRIFDVSTARILHRLTPIKSGGGSLIPIPLPKIGKSEDTNPFFNLPAPVAFSSSGKVLVSGGNGGVKVWDIAKSSVLYQMANKEYVPLVALSSDGALVAGVVEGYRIKIWSTATGKESRIINTDIAALSSLSFSLDGALIACGNINGTLKAYTVNDGKELKKLIDGPGEEDFIAVGRKVGRVPIVGDVGDAFSSLIEAGDQLRNLLFKNKSIRAVAFNPDSKSLAYQAGDNVIHVLRLEDNKEILTVEQDDPFDTDDAKNKGPGKKVSAAVTAKKPSEAISAYFRQLCPIRYSTDGKTLNGCKNFKNIQRWDAVTGQELATLAVAKRGSIKGQKVPIPFPLTTVPRFANDKLLLTSSFAGGVKLWDLEKRSNPQRIVETSPALGNNLPVSPDGQLLLHVSPDEKTLTVRGLNSEKDIQSFAVEDPPTQKIIAAQFSPDNKMVVLEILEEKVRLKFFASRKVQLRIMDISSGQRVFDAGNILENQFSFSPDTKKFAYMPKGQSIWDSFRNKTEIDVYEVGQPAAWRELYEKDVEREFQSNFVSKVVFSSDSKLMASEDKDKIKVWEADNGKELYDHKLDLGTDVSSFIFVPQKNVLTFTIFSKIYSWDLISKRVEKLKIETDVWGSLAYSPNGKTIALGGVENKVRLFNVATQDELGILVAPNEDDWMLTTPDGRFDTSRLDEIEEVHWIMPNEPYNPEPVEVFMRYFYEPRLLTRLLSADEFGELPDLAKTNRAQPKVKIKEVIPVNADTVRITVEVADAASETQTDAQGQPRRSGVYDVRLFRNGQLVGYSTPAAENSVAPSVTQTLTEELAAWRAANKIQLDAGAGRTLLTFNNVKVPQRSEKSEIVFSAYAFNEDRVKSLTDRFHYALPAAAQARKGRAYIISVGVTAFENPTFNLEFPGNDAKELQVAMARDLAATGQFSEIVPISLTSKYKKQGEQTVDSENLATKENFRRVLTRLNNRAQQATMETIKPAAAAALALTPRPTKAARGKKPPAKVVTAPATKTKSDKADMPRPASGGSIANFDKLRPATPDDMVLILYSSHGYADRAGNFYLIPYDTGAGTQKVFTDQVRRHSISSDDLSLWLRDVDAGELVLIVDACHSTAAVEGGGFRPGPMGSRGLGQLSYDKGMRILTATQADNVALENKSISQGLLSYALTRDGLGSQHADFKPVDKTITLLEWLEYGEDRVPKLNEQIRNGQISSASSPAGDQPRLILQDNARGLQDTGTTTPITGDSPAPGLNAGTIPAANNNAQANAGRLQQPALFDFARGSRDTIVARNP